MLYCIFIAFDGFFILSLIFIDVAQVVISITIPWIGLDGLFVPMNGIIYLFLPLKHDSHVIVGTVILVVGPNTFHVVFQGVVVLSEFIIGYSNRVVDLIDVFIELVDALIGFCVVSNSLIVVFFVVIRQTHVVVKVVRVYIELLHMTLNDVI